MKAWIWLRVASGLSAFFALGHTMGHFRGPSHSAANDLVVSTMKTFHFDVMGSSRTYWDFYQGFSLFVIITPALLAVLMWLLSDVARTRPADARPMVIALLVGHILFAVVGWTNFFIAPAMINTLAAVCLIFAAADA